MGLWRRTDYLTGGVAYGEVSANGTQLAGGLFMGSTSATKVGWAAGAGADYALSKNLSLRAEYLYVSFDGVGGPSVGLVPPPFPSFVGAFSTGTFGTSHHSRRPELSLQLERSGSSLREVLIGHAAVERTSGHGGGAFFLVPVQIDRRNPMHQATVR